MTPGWPANRAMTCSTQQRYQNCKVGIDDGKSFTESLRDDLIDRFVGALFGLW